MRIGKATVDVLATQKRRAEFEALADKLGEWPTSKLAGGASPRTFDGKPIHGRGGISAVVLRRFGAWQRVNVKTLIKEGRQAVEAAELNAMRERLGLALTKPKKTKRKGRRK